MFNFNPEMYVKKIKKIKYLIIVYMSNIYTEINRKIDVYVNNPISYVFGKETRNIIIGFIALGIAIKIAHRI